MPRWIPGQARDDILELNTLDSDAQKQEAFWSTPAQLGARLVSDKAKYTEVIEKAHVKLTP